MVKNTVELLKSGELLPLMEQFYSIQGEGYHTGKASYFIRIGGCDVGCHWCDVKESWNEELHPATKTDLIIETAMQYAKTVIITGGEPLMWNMSYITNLLKNKGVNVHVETSGSYPLSGIWDWICLSPKKNKMPLDEIYLKADELKIIIFNKNDFKFAMMEAKKVTLLCKLYLQPEWSKREKMTPLIIDFVLKNPQWNISLQTHKYLKIP